MPTYTYECEFCKDRVELIQKISEKKNPVCTRPDCNLPDGSQRVMETVMMPSSFVLKGGGWAKDGYSSTKGNK